MHFLPVVILTSLLYPGVASAASVSTEQPNGCVQLANKAGADVSCYNTVGEKELAKLLASKKAAAPNKITLSSMTGIEKKSNVSDCITLADTLTSGEHFAAATDFQLPKGLHYFEFEALPTQTELYIYLIGEKTSVLFPWFNKPNPASWSKVMDNGSFTPIFSQTETSPKAQRLKLVVQSNADQKVQVRWQHGHAGVTAYTGKKENISSICKAQFGQIVDVR